MLVTFLSILKIIGIVLACIVGFVLCLVLLILLVPVQYSVAGDRMKPKEEVEKVPVHGKAAVSWFFHFIHGEIIYNDGVNLIIRVLGIPLYNKKRKDAKAAAKESKSPKWRHKKKEESADFEESVEELELTEEEQSMVLAETPVLQEEKAEISEPFVNSEREEEPEDCAEDKKTKKKKKSFADFVNKIEQFIGAIPRKFEEVRQLILDKVNGFVETIRYYYKLLQTKGSKYVFEFIKKELKCIFKHIKPRCVKGKVLYSSDDPASSAGMCRYYGYALPYLPRRLNVDIGFGEKYMYFDLKVKGHITLGYLVIQGLKIVLNKRLRIFIKKMKRED